MNNKFDNFFNDPTKIMGDKKFQPTLSMKVETLMALAGRNPYWWKNPDARLGMASLIHDCNCDLSECMDTGEKPDLHVFGAAFMMVMNDLLRSTSDFACDKEREMFDYDMDEEDFES